MNVRAVDPARSRIVLVGTPVYDDPALADVPQIARNLTDLVSVFTDEALGGFPAEHCVVAPPDATVDQVGDLMDTAAEQAEDLLLFYFAGHGLIGARGELFLALRGTRFRNPAYSGLRFDTVRDTFLDLHTKAANRAVIVDSCFSGRAIGPTLSGGAGALADGLEITGSYTLASAPPNGLALVREGEAHTAFTGRLLELLRGGSTQAGDLISFREIYQHLHARLRADGLPLPQVRGTATTDSLGLVRNVRLAPVVPEPVPEEIRTLLDSSLPAARELGVTLLADWFSSSDPPRVLAAKMALEEVQARDIQPVADAARHVLMMRSGKTAAGQSDAAQVQYATALLNRAESMVPTIVGQTRKVEVLARIAQLLPPADDETASRAADRALILLSGIADERKRAEGLARVAEGLIGVDPQRAERLATEAERIAFMPADPETEAIQATKIALALAWHSQRASRVIDQARTFTVVIGQLDLRTNVLASIAWASARAGLRRLAVLLADEVEELAERLADPDAKGRALAVTASAVALIDLARAADMAGQAEALADAITDQEARSFVLAHAAIALAKTDAPRARRMARRAVNLIDLTADQDETGNSVLQAIGTALAMIEPTRAESFAEKIADPYAKAKALVAIARVCLKPAGS